MFSKVFFIAAALIAFVGGSPVPGGTPAPGGYPAPGGSPAPGIQNSCNAGATHCCNDTSASSSNQAKDLADLFGLDFSQFTPQTSAVCTPITGIGAGQGGSCTQQSACCAGNTFNGILVIGCSPLGTKL